VRLVADRRAQAHHHHRATVAGVLRMARHEAHSDVLLGRKHPELRGGLSLMLIPTGRYGLLVRLAWHAPALGDPCMALLQRALSIFERTKMRRRWLEYFGHLRGYAYWRGVRDMFSSWNDLLTYQTGASPPPRQRLDITGGLPAELPPLWVDGPSTLEVTYQDRRLGEVSLPGSLGVPLRPYLARQIAEQLSLQIWVEVSQARQLPWDEGRQP